MVLLVVLLVLVVAGVVAYTIGERVFRDTAETQIERSLDESRPSGVTGSFAAEIGGGSALLQYVRGSFDDVTITSRNLHIAGASSSAVIHVQGLPVNGGTIETATAKLVVGQAAFKDIPALRNVGATAPKLGKGTLSTTLTRTILGIALRVSVQLKPTLDDQTVRLKPTAATITAGPASVPATAIVQQLLPDGVSVCAAEYLPRGITLTSVAIKPQEAVAGLSAKNIDLETLDSAKVGSCG